MRAQKQLLDMMERSLVSTLDRLDAMQSRVVAVEHALAAATKPPSPAPAAAQPPPPPAAAPSSGAARARAAPARPLSAAPLQTHACSGRHFALCGSSDQGLMILTDRDPPLQLGRAASLLVHHEHGPSVQSFALLCMSLERSLVSLRVRLCERRERCCVVPPRVAVRLLPPRQRRCG